MQPLGEALKAAKVDGQPWKQELNRFLLQYRTTPHGTTGVPPSEILFNRAVKGKIPVITRKKVINRQKEPKKGTEQKCKAERHTNW